MTLHKYIIQILFTFILTGCGQIDFVYKEKKDITNPLYNKTAFDFSGKEISNLYRYTTTYFGRSDNPNYKLRINIEEEKTKRAVQTNQAISKLDYELKFVFVVNYIEKECSVFSTDVYSRFTYIPKSSGYNFGSDQSLEKMYERASEKALDQFTNLVTGSNLSSCLSEN